MTAVTAIPGRAPTPGADIIARARQPLSEQARVAMVSLSRMLLNEIERYIDSQMEHILAQRPDLASNEVFASTVREVCRYNMTAFAHILAGSDPSTEAAAVRAAAFTSGEMLSKAGVSLPELLQIYRRGQALLLQDFLGQAFGEIDQASPFDEILHQCMIWWGAHVDQTLGHTVEGLVKDYERLRTHFQARQLRTVEAVLQGRLTDVAQASSELHYELAAWHLGFVIAHPPGAARDDFESAVEGFTEHAARALGAPRTLLIPFNSRENWAWMGSGDRLDPPSAATLRRAAIELDVRVSIGTPARGLPGFITTNLQARYANLAVENIPDAAAFTAYREVAILSLIKPDKDRLSIFVMDQLGGLASTDQRIAELRHTVAVYLAEGRNAPRAAEVLHTHKNTVHYRIARAEEIRRRPITDSTLELELALRLITNHGDWILHD